MPFKGVKCIMVKLLYGCVLTSLAVSSASALIPLLLLCGRKGWITPSSKSCFHLLPITPSSGGGSQGAAPADSTGFLYILLLPCSFPPPPYPTPPHPIPSACFSGTLLVLRDPRAQEFLQFSVSAHTLFKLTLFSCLPPVLSF